MRVKTGVLAATVAAVALTTVFSGGAATGAERSRPAAASQAKPAGPAALLSTVTVNADGVRYRACPETCPALGQVNRGQKFDVFRSGGPDLTWANGNLWGGPSNVWIRWDFLS